MSLLAELLVSACMLDWNIRNLLAYPIHVVSYLILLLKFEQLLESLIFFSASLEGSIWRRGQLGLCWLFQCLRK